MKKSFFVAVLLLMATFWGCDDHIVEDNLTREGRWYINNFSSESFTVSIEGNEMLLELRDGPIVTLVGADTYDVEITRPNESDYWAVGPHYSSDDIVISFEFSNGVKHTFQGALIERDVRYATSWVVKDVDDVVEHLYNFTDADYQRIMALYE
ncbi:MAG: hypothetical protein J6K24_03190 [Tidjanibacter sp.]|nr:hypothetical protein [Tidjanibacter sp.]